MEEKLHSFLQSGLLERYLVGDTSIAENLEVEHLIEAHPEINDEYQKLQKNLEIVAKANAVEAPLGVLNKVLLTTKEETKIIHISKNKTSWYSIAASIAAVAFGAISLYFYQENKALNNENNVVVDEIFDLRDDINKNNSKLDALAIQLQKLNNPDAKKYVLRGNARARDLETVAYINPVEKTSMIDVVSLPKLPKNQYYQIRAELEDKMVSLGMLEDYQRSLKPIPYFEDALALSIAIKNKNDDNPLEEQEVAEISLKDK
ncbi:MAG: anti-sigma factor [Winogradskyella sp.]|uniref:RNA polymerase subunit sigma-70 n=1 Tax=Winogradskyella sp. TaxID=1883156 RepID=UPI0017B76418|nr:RNA polymerase subunit sigma-70 [Winogradskyella sp.]MBT8244502.1 RNA polymerase subunit sigma-70 [Winogradskyella sp.]NNK23944.1 anti-sigma factor [Winogradskyella sp.]